MNDFKIITATLPDREHEVAEIWYKGKCWAEVSQEKLGCFDIEFYNHPENICWKISYNDAVNALEKAKNRLSNNNRRNPFQ